MKMENEFKCFWLLTLKEMTTRKVAVLLWSGSDILDSISKFHDGELETEDVELETEDGERQWQGIFDNKIRAKALKLNLPKELKENLIDAVRLISLEVKTWKQIHQVYLKDLVRRFAPPDLNILRWTPEGAVDYKETAEVLINCVWLDVVLRYKIAAQYCLESHVQDLWTKLPEGEKWNFERAENVWTQYHIRLDLPSCWTRMRGGKLSRMNLWARLSFTNIDSFHQFAFERSAKRGNKSAAEYFFQKMTRAEREASLMRTARAVLEDTTLDPFPAKRHSDLFRYLLSVMTPRQRVDTVRAHPIKVFSCFVDWPWQGLVSENAGLLWTFLTARADEFLGAIGTRFGDPYLSKWFKEFSKLGPTDFSKRYENVKLDYDIRHLCSYIHLGCINLVFKNVSKEIRLKLVFNDEAFGFFFDSYRLDLVKAFLRAAKLSREEKERLKRAFGEYLDHAITGRSVRHRFKWFFALLDETDESAESDEE